VVDGRVNQLRARVGFTQTHRPGLYRGDDDLTSFSAGVRAAQFALALLR
jgi:hypothetical protein